MTEVFQPGVNQAHESATPERQWRYHGWVPEPRLNSYSVKVSEYKFIQNLISIPGSAET
ncbi:hypothetical protein [Emticicia sp. TH156]|uniref:hypothetical protein n=1 Tax=Emticicia sp. TH156 TaxID=2067454 RepID=UPI001303FCF7|nr:hypothetical protein [Emticicia sp. TH156]